MKRPSMNMPLRYGTSRRTKVTADHLPQCEIIGPLRTHCLRRHSLPDSSLANLQSRALDAPKLELCIERNMAAMMP